MVPAAKCCIDSGRSPKNLVTYPAMGKLPVSSLTPQAACLSKKSADLLIFPRDIYTTSRGHAQPS
jgi:hypothetical protein